MDAATNAETDTVTTKPVSDTGKSEAVSDAGKSEGDTPAEGSVRRGGTVSNSFNAVIASENDDRYVGSGEKDGENTTRTRIAIMSDIHYVTDQLIGELGREDLSNAALTEIRLMEEIDAILNAALKGASDTNPDALLICGDLVSNGELLGAKALAAKLKAAREMNGFANTGFYVVNGNHDINNSYAVDFTGDTEKGADRVQPSDFKEVFSGLGYGDDDHWAGVSAVLTGHTHANDIATYVTKNNNVLYDVETAALCAYPCLWREFDIVTTGEGEEKSYTISIDTTYINDLSEADTSSWSFTIGGKIKTFDGDYNGNLQDYAYEKSGINEESLDDMAMYLAKNYLSDIVTHEGGLGGYLKEQLEIPEEKSLGEYMAESIRNALSGFPGFTKEINNVLFKG